MLLTDVLELYSLTPATREKLLTLARVIAAFSGEDIIVNIKSQGHSRPDQAGQHFFEFDILKGESTRAGAEGIQEFLGPDYVVRLEADHMSIKYSPD